MHEIALAESVMATALNTARKRQSPVLRLIVKVGQLQQIETDVLRQCLHGVHPHNEPLLEEMAIVLETEPAGFVCRACTRSFGLDDLSAPPDDVELEAIHFIPELAHSYIQCPSCHGPDFDVAAGRGVWIDRIETAA
ncbi:MAG: hydrogenase maturation nickel metallochaperone HypA [Gemmatimonadetes bacterium]|jgi:hydrogenase nickel incorporation protein HypA/HybF|nr:hydrogenase maturation nickel metallochaperone HypA [Gemmatimonadota bacterium]MBT5055408.1 hydrogenase maturation nickel metallochaperone HypA [Gemmatimonadota bacterium]MBT5143472.1 hydrogenase maturation nickel metallochaperone HypA [Gemmatimonadota bacterium]MBT5589380.1 hydrogenase maturation nickel metallochaperone HypA [Gemmatimonadota bacterium]MBT5963805.1 hydrogenase maturation nickel metallochaperone HypA [Gemmatimonadota bacterium]